MSLSHIIWNVKPEMFSIGNVPVLYYSFFYFIAFFVAWIFVFMIYYREKIPLHYGFQLYFFMFVGITLGARVGHCLIYEFPYYKSHIIEIFLPIKIYGSKIVWSSFKGLSSHGGAVGIILAIIFYALFTKQSIVRSMDLITMLTGWCCAWLRVGNLMNSEIVGIPTQVPWAFVFTRYDHLPRHPVQLYEAIAYMALFAFSLWVYFKRWDRLPKGFMFGMNLAGGFMLRFFLEFFKENLLEVEKNMMLHVGQLWSIPPIIIGLYFMFFYQKVGSNRK